MMMMLQIISNFGALGIHSRSEKFDTSDISVDEDDGDGDWCPSESEENMLLLTTPPKQSIKRRAWRSGEKRKIRETFSEYIYTGSKTTSPRPTSKNFKSLASSGFLPSLSDEGTPQKIKRLRSTVHNYRRLEEEKGRRALAKRFH